MSLRVEFNQQNFLLEGTCVGVGQAADNELVFLGEPALEPHHAVLRLVQNRWLIEAVDAEAICISNGRPVKFGWLSAGDRVRLTQAGPELIFEPAGFRPPPAELVQAFSNQASSQEKLLRGSDRVDRFMGSFNTHSPNLPQENQISVESVRLAPAVSVRRLKDFVISKQNIFPEKWRSTAWTGLSCLTGCVVLVLIVFWFSKSTSQAEPEPISKSIPSSVGAEVASSTATDEHSPEMTVASSVNRPVENKANSIPLNPPEEGAKTAAEELLRETIPLDPRDLLVLTGVGNLRNESRPHVMGVGWLWNPRTAVVSRMLGEAVQGVVQLSAKSDSPLQACVIQGIPLELAEIQHPPECPEVSFLILKSPAVLETCVAEQVRNVSAVDVERMRARKELIQLFSFQQLPRFEKAQGNHGMPLVAYEPEIIHFVSQPAGFVYEQQQHNFKPDVTAPLPERGGVLLDENKKIMGMVLLDSSVLWTNRLLPALKSLP